MIFDAGSGIIPLGKALLEEGVTEIDLFFSHAHYDHILGLPYFLPAFWNKAKLRIWAGHMQDGSTPEQLVDGIFRPPYFPITKEYMRADVEYHKFSPGDVLRPSPGVRIVTGSLTHPNGAVGYRIERAGATFCYLTDFEHDGGVGDAEIRRLAKNADLVLLDATYTPEEYPRYVKFGHSTWEHCGALCAEAGVGRWGMFHHMHMRTDIDQQTIEDAARQSIQTHSPYVRDSTFSFSKFQAGPEVIALADALPAAARSAAAAEDDEDPANQVAAAMREGKSRRDPVKLVQLGIVAVWSVLFLEGDRGRWLHIRSGSISSSTRSASSGPPRRRWPNWSVYFSIVFDMVLLYVVIWRFHGYGSAAGLLSQGADV